MGSHSVTCYPTQVNMPCPNPSLQAGTRTRITYAREMKGWVDLGYPAVQWLGVLTYQITQCYLLPNASEYALPCPNPSLQVGTRFTYAREMGGWVDLGYPAVQWLGVLTYQITVLPATQHEWIYPALTLACRWVLDLLMPERWRAELT